MKVCSVCQRCYQDDVAICAEAEHGDLTEKSDKTREAVEGYRLDRLLEKRLHREIYRATHVPSQKEVLASFIKTGSAGDSTQKLQEEVQAVFSLNHPNIARVYEFGKVSDEEFYLVQEAFPGETLDDYLKKVGRLPERDAVFIARQVAEALEALHGAGVVHRAVSPKTIVFTEAANKNLSIKLQDFDFGGIRQQAVVAGANGVDAQTAALSYLSPEQISGTAVEAQTDIYSLGVVLYEMLSGALPYSAPSVQAIVNYIFNEQPFETLRFDVRALLSHLLRESLQKRTNLRTPKAGTLARQLRHIEQLVAPAPIVFRDFQSSPAAPPAKVVSKVEPVVIPEQNFAEPESVIEELPIEETVQIVELPIEEAVQDVELPVEEIVQTASEVSPEIERQQVLVDFVSPEKISEVYPESTPASAFPPDLPAEEAAPEAEKIELLLDEEEIAGEEVAESIEEVPFVEETVLAQETRNESVSAPTDDSAEVEEERPRAFIHLNEFYTSLKIEPQLLKNAEPDEDLIEYETIDDQTIDVPEPLEAVKPAAEPAADLFNSFDTYSDGRQALPGRQVFYVAGGVGAVLVLLGLVFGGYFSNDQNQESSRQSLAPAAAPVKLEKPAAKSVEPAAVTKTTAEREDEIEPTVGSRENETPTRREKIPAENKTPVENKIKSGSSDQPPKAAVRAKPSAKQTVAAIDSAPIQKPKPPAAPKGDGLTRPRIVSKAN